MPTDTPKMVAYRADAEAQLAKAKSFLPSGSLARPELAVAHAQIAASAAYLLEVQGRIDGQIPGA